MCMTPLEQRAMFRDLEQSVRAASGAKSDRPEWLAWLRLALRRPPAQPDLAAQGIPAE